MTGYFSSLLHYTRASEPRRGVVQTSLPKQSSDPTRIVEQHERVLVDRDRNAEKRSTPDVTEATSPARNEMVLNPGSIPDRSPEVASTPELQSGSNERDESVVKEERNVTSDRPAFEVMEEVEAHSVQDEPVQQKEESLEQHESIEIHEQQQPKVITQEDLIGEQSTQSVEPLPEKIEPRELQATIQIRPSEQTEDHLPEAQFKVEFPNEQSSLSEIEQVKEVKPTESRVEHVQEVDERQVIWKQVYQDVRSWVADSPAVETVLDKPYGEKENIQIVERIIPHSDQARTQSSRSESHPITQRIESQELELTIGSINVTIETPESHAHRSTPQAGDQDMGEPPSSLSRDYLRLR